MSYPNERTYKNQLLQKCRDIMKKNDLTVEQKLQVIHAHAAASGKSYSKQLETYGQSMKRRIDDATAAHNSSSKMAKGSP